MRLRLLAILFCTIALVSCSDDEQAVDMSIDSSPTTTSIEARDSNCRLAAFPSQRDDVRSVVSKSGDVVDGARMLQVLAVGADPIAVRAPSAAVLETIESKPGGVYELSARHPCGMVWRIQQLTDLTSELDAVVPSAGAKPSSPVAINAGQPLGRAAGTYKFGISVNDGNACPVELLPPSDLDAFQPLLSVEDDEGPCARV